MNWLIQLLISCCIAAARYSFVTRSFSFLFCSFSFISSPPPLLQLSFSFYQRLGFHSIYFYLFTRWLVHAVVVVVCTVHLHTPRNCCQFFWLWLHHRRFDSPRSHFFFSIEFLSNQHGSIQLQNLIDLCISAIFNESYSFKLTALVQSTNDIGVDSPPPTLLQLFSKWKQLNSTSIDSVKNATNWSIFHFFCKSNYFNIVLHRFEERCGFDSLQVHKSFFFLI